MFFITPSVPVTTTGIMQLSMSPPSSVHEQITVLVPIGKRVPDCGLHIMERKFGKVSASVQDGVVNVTVLPKLPGTELTCTGGGQVIVGPVFKSENL